MAHSRHKYPLNAVCKEVLVTLLASDIHSTLRGLFVVAMTMLQKPFNIDEFSVH